MGSWLGRCGLRLAHCPQGCAPFWLLLTGPCLGCSTAGPYPFLVASRTKPRLPPVTCTRPPPPSSVSTPGHGCTLSCSCSAENMAFRTLCPPSSPSFGVAPAHRPLWPPQQSQALPQSQCVSRRPCRLVPAVGQALLGPYRWGFLWLYLQAEGTAVLRSLWMAASAWRLCGGDAWGLSQGASWRRSWCL